MIQNLNPISFQKFGTILNPNSHTLVPMEERLGLALKREQLPVRKAQENVHLYPQPGLCVLSVAQQGQEYAHFYLDKPVQLKDGLSFYLTPFDDRVTLHISGKYQMTDVLPSGTDFRVHHKLGLPRLYTFFYQEREQGFVFPGESHPMYELTYVDKGTLHCVSEGLDVKLEPGDMILNSPGQWHMHYADIGVAPGYVTISFDIDGLDLSELAGRRFQSPQRAIDLLRHMLREQEHPDAYTEDVILGQLRQLLLVLLRQSREQPSPICKPQGFHNENEIIRKAQQYISQNVRTKLSVPLVALNTDVSASYLTSLFHKHLQISPGEYIRRIKLQESKQMIREGNMNFSEIANALNYSTIHHFSRQFKEKFGITPTEYAKSVK